MTGSTRSSPFVMQAAREIITADGTHMERQVIAIEQAVSENPNLAFDLARSLIESSCKTILHDRDREVENSWKIPRLLKETLASIQLVPDSHAKDEECINALKKTAGGLQTVIQGIAEMRNKYGFASHGRDAYSQMLESIQAELVARAADAVVCFLFRTHRAYSFIDLPIRMNYRDNPEFNSSIDNLNDVASIFGVEYLPSEIVFNLDIVAYREYLLEYMNSESNPSNELEPGSEE